MKKRVMILALCALSLVAFIPDPTPKYKVELTVQEWETVIGTLYELPKKQADPLIQKIVGQIQPQLPQDSMKKK